MNIQRRFAPRGGNFEPESVAGLTGISTFGLDPIDDPREGIAEAFRALTLRQAAEEVAGLVGGCKSRPVLSQGNPAS
jgi:hypothetical protein